ncbi:MAG: hypothetical protein M1814_001188 [Vezdaea aestivalis]|nr:MAG: hypothetical protein M1814_001188 [Vezdaea aestivalis]
MTYNVFEPHPTVPRTQYIGSGRGGAGNIHRAPSSTTTVSPANPPPSRTTLHPASTFMTGRGGAGNLVHNTTSERAIFSFDEELEREAKVEEKSAPVYYVGRGGAGNYSYSRGRSWAWEQPRSVRSNSVGSRDTQRSDASDRSTSSKVGNAWSRFSQALKGGSNHDQE